MAKRRINYINGNIPENISDILANADEQDLKILTVLLMAANEKGEVEDSLMLEKKLGISKSELDASLKFWCGAGIIGNVRAQKNKAEETAKKNTSTVPTVETAHRNGVIESGGIDVYNSTELVTLLESRAVSACFIDEAQQVFGKTFSPLDTSIVVGLVDQYGFEEDAVLELLAYVKRLEKKGVKYVEKVAIGFYDDGITTASDVSQKISLIERSKEDVFRIKQIFGFGARSLTKTEQALFEKWTLTYGYGIDVIKFAYDMMIDAIQRPVPKYADKIIEKWHCEGLRTFAEVEAYEKNKKDSGSQSGENKGDTQKSYDLDDFFEAAIQRSFRDLK